MWELAILDMKNKDILGLPWERCYCLSEWNLHRVACLQGRTGTGTMSGFVEIRIGSGTGMPFVYSYTILFFPPWLYILIAFNLGVSPLLPLQASLSVLCPLLILSAMPLPSASLFPAASWPLLPASFCLNAFLLLLPAANCSLLLPLRLKFPQRRALMGSASQHPVWACKGFEEFGAD